MGIWVEGTIAKLNQALLSASAGVAYITPYIERLMDASVDAYKLVSDIADLYQRHHSHTRIAAASIRNPQQAEKVELAGAHVLVMQNDMLNQLLDSDLTHTWIERFEDNWKQIPYSLKR